MAWLNKSVWGLKYKWQLQQFSLSPPAFASPLLSCQRAERARELPSLVTATGCFISGNFSMRFVYTGPRLAKGSRSSSSTTKEWVLMPTKGGKGNSLPTSFCHCLLLPALALLIPASFRAVPCPDQGSFDLLQTIGNIIHQRLLFPLSLPLSHSFCLSFYTRFANCFAQISMQSVELFTLFFSSILQSFNHVSFAFLCFCLFNSKAKSWARFSPVSIFLCSLSCKRAENKIVGDYSRSFWRLFWANWKRN